MKTIFHTLVITLFLIIPFAASAQEVEMADQFRAEGKIYIVIAVFAIILTGLFVYVFSLDRKIGKLEEHNDK